ncbi:hypothetical protein [Actinoallomurus sp. NPDC050550]|uniref:hypothetical protein n=1 Tax=Actinoallomurus sp. NPDC050550 TaxID=3154937 RepID=UPI00340FD9F9
MTPEVLPVDADHAEIRTRLAAVGWVVLVDGDGEPVTLLTPDLADRAEPPPVILVAADTTAAEFVSSSAVTLLDLADDIPGLVRVSDGRPVGVLPVEELDALLATGGYEPPPTTMGPFGAATDAILPGGARVPKARVRCAEPGCGWLNELDFYDRTAPPRCANEGLPEHPLRLATRGG